MTTGTLRLFEPSFAGVEAVNTPQLSLPMENVMPDHDHREHQDTRYDHLDADQQRDFAEERYNTDMCPACSSSPCDGPAGKGSCEFDELDTPDELDPNVDADHIWRNR